MSTISNNGKFINLDGVKVYYNSKENTIHIISTDEDLVGKPFIITLKQGTETETTLRELLIDKGVIKPSENVPVDTIPKFVSYPIGEPKLFPNLIRMGSGNNSTPVYLDMETANNALVVGRAGSGKTVFLKSFILHCIKNPEHWKFVGIDLNTKELAFVERFQKSVLRVATTLEDAVKAVHFVNDEMETRYNLMKEQGVRSFKEIKDVQGNSLPSIMFMIEETLMFLDEEDKYQDDYETKNQLRKEALLLVGRIARNGSAAGIHLVLSSQRPESSVIKGELKENLQTRIILGQRDNIVSHLMFGENNIEETPNSGIAGRAYISSPGLIIDGKRISKIYQFQIYFVSPHLLDETNEED